jgi:hypothetical protein
MLRDGLNAHLEPSAAPSRSRSKRANGTHQSYVEAIGAGTVKSRLARTNALGETRTHALAGARTA